MGHSCEQQYLQRLRHRILPFLYLDCHLGSIPKGYTQTVLQALSHFVGSDVFLSTHTTRAVRLQVDDDGLSGGSLGKYAAGDLFIACFNLYCRFVGEPLGRWVKMDVVVG